MYTVTGNEPLVGSGGGGGVWTVALIHRGTLAAGVGYG